MEKPPARAKHSMVGVGLRTDHFSVFENDFQTQVEWFEVISENFISTRGRPWEILTKMREDFPIACHGVSLSLAGPEKLNTNYLEKLSALYKEVDPFIISDHLCWTGLEKNNLHNLLPFPYSDEMLNYIAERVDQVQEKFKRPIALENLSAYFSMKESQYTEWEFLDKLAKKTGCFLLLDINNVFVNSYNQKFDPLDFLNNIPHERVAEIHLAGFTDYGTFLFDTHSNPVYDDVWELYQHYSQLNPGVPTLIEWDENIPSFEVLEEEALKAKRIAMVRANDV